MLNSQKTKNMKFGRKLGMISIPLDGVAPEQAEKLPGKLSFRKWLHWKKYKDMG